MRNFIVSLAAIALSATVAQAQFTDLSAAAYNGKTKIKQAHAAIDANFALLESGVGAGATALSVTNGQVVTVAAGTYIVTSLGGANDTTNTITLVAPTAAGQTVKLLVATASTNLVTIADSGTVAASGAILLDFNDSAQLTAVDASTWCLDYESNN